MDVRTIPDWVSTLSVYLTILFHWLIQLSVVLWHRCLRELYIAKWYYLFYILQDYSMLAVSFSNTLYSFIFFIVDISLGQLHFSIIIKVANIFQDIPSNISPRLWLSRISLALSLILSIFFFNYINSTDNHSSHFLSSSEIFWSFSISNL